MNFQKILHAYVEEMYPLEKGVIISEPDKILLVGDCRINRRQIKHIVEQRKAEGKSSEGIRQIIDLLSAVITNPEFEVSNYNQKYAGSIVRAKIFPKSEQGIVAVIDREQSGKHDLITAYLCSPKKIYKLKKKLDTTAAGKTPHS